MPSWTDELKQEVIQDYQERNPTPENTIALLKELAEKYEKTPNGVMMILNKAKVYVKAASATPAAGTAKVARVSKKDLQAALISAIEVDAGLDVDLEIIEKLTGKAAVYFTTIIKEITKEE